MGGDLRLEQLLGPGHALDVIGVGVRGDDHLAVGQVEIHPANQIDDLVGRFQIADVDQQELAAAVDEIDVDAQPPAGLVVHLDDVREQVLPGQHDCRAPQRSLIGLQKKNRKALHQGRRPINPGKMPSDHALCLQGDEKDREGEFNDLKEFSLSR